jgi:threonine synthase
MEADMEIMYESTRNSKERVTASQAVLKGLAPDGGLYVPERIPVLDKTLEEFSDMDYRQTAYEVMKLFLTDYTETELKNCINAAYDNKFDTEEICELRKADDAYFLELFHGRTLAFKDMALSILPHLLTAAAKKNDMKEKIVILTATSGDTGKAALAGFADVPGTKIIVFYPKSGVSKVTSPCSGSIRASSSWTAGRICKKRGGTSSTRTTARVLPPGLQSTCARVPWGCTRASSVCGAPTGNGHGSGRGDRR